MRFSGATALLLGSGALAQDLGSCIAAKATDIARQASCPENSTLADCLAGGSSANAIADIEACIKALDCQAVDPFAVAQAVFQACSNAAAAPQKRSPQGAAASLPQQTPEVPAAAPNPDKHAAAMPTPTLSRRDGAPLQCLITETVSTSTCSVETTGNRLHTISCFETQVAKSRCAPGLMCSMDPTGADVCMKMHNTLDIGGIIISIIFGVSIVIGVSALTFMCCKERKYQKKLEARAEATALARAQTKKQRAEQRSPLMRQGEGGGDPFHDRNRS